jgi:rhamnose transport system permease protein
MASDVDIAPAPAVAGPRRTRLQAVYRQREASLVAVLALVVVVMATQNSAFLELDSLQGLLRNASVLTIVGVGMACVVITKNIDLSVGSMVGLSAFAAGDFLKDHPDANLVLVFLIGGGVGLVLGMVNASLVTFGQIPSIVATLGTLFVFRGIDSIVAGNLKQVTADDVPQRFADFGYSTVLGIPTLAWIALAVVLVFAHALRSTRMGRQLYAIGSNAEAARLAGVRVNLHVFGAFAICGLLSGLAGVLWVAQYTGADAHTASGLEFVVVAAVVVGGVNIFGGSGTIAGVALGALLLTAIQTGLTMLKVSQFWPDAIYGMALLTAVTVDALLNRRIQAALMRRRPL